MKTKLRTREVQAALAVLGYYDGPMDGDYRSVDYRADLRRFQRDYRSVAGAADGWYGPKTEKALLPLVKLIDQSTCSRSLAPSAGA